MSHIYHCEQHGNAMGTWEAYCLENCVAAVGDTPAHARRKLERFLRSYLVAAGAAGSPAIRVHFYRLHLLWWAVRRPFSRNVWTVRLPRMVKRATHG